MWQACSALANDRDARLACFDRWASQQSAPVTPPRPTVAATPFTITITQPPEHDCKSHAYSELSRFWELEAGSDCGTLGIRGYRPISLSWIGSDSVNTQPSSPSSENTTAAAQPYNSNETRIQLSVRTKIAQGLLTRNQALLRDSLWFGYTQQSYWQLFNGELSRPFRTTDHEPEITYIYPTDAELPGGWRWRYSGASLVHQSNGQSLPLSRSWNRFVLQTGIENGDQFRLQARLWKRINENAANDDNPNISDLIGRAEVAAFWNVNPDNTLGATVRHSLRENANGSVRLEWLKKLGTGSAGTESGLRFHTQLFNGYGDSLVDYNRKRTVLSVGLSLVDW
jgi:phospholipase A1